MKKLRILLADDHDLVRQGLQTLIENEPGWKVCAVASNGLDAVAEAKKLRPDVVVLDMIMPGLNGLEITREIRRCVPECEILIFTGSETDELIRDAYKAGAKGFVLKTEAGRYLTDALRHLGEHKPFFTETASEVVFARFAAPKTDSPKSEKAGRLTNAEKQLVQLLASGNSNQAAARKLKLSTRAIENQRSAIMQKLKLETFAELVRYAVRNKIIEA